MTPSSAPRTAAAPSPAIDIPPHISEAIAARLAPLSKRRSRAIAELRAAQEAVTIAENLVLAALPKRLDLDWIGQVLRLDSKDLHEAFALVRGATPYRAIMAVRLEAARLTMARHPRLAAAAVAMQCGFPGYARFLLEWRTIYGDLEPSTRKARTLRSSRERSVAKANIRRMDPTRPPRHR